MNFMKSYQAIIIGLLLGIFAGAIFPQAISFYGFLATAFVKLLKCLIVPLVLASLISGIAHLKTVDKMGRLGIWTFVYFIGTTAASIGIGLLCVSLISPGHLSDISLEAAKVTVPEATSIVDVILRMIPANFFAALVQANMLQIIVMALAIGIGLHFLPREKRICLQSFFDALNDLMMVFIQGVLVLTPLGVFALMAQMMVKMGTQSFAPLLYYMGTVLLGLLVVAVVLVPMLLMFISKRTPIAVAKAAMTGLLTAFSAASSAAALPFIMRSLSKDLDQPDEVVGFVMPLGITLNMNGTALYQAVATVFIAQLYGVELALAQYLLIVFTGILAAVSAAAVPSAGLITLSVIMTTVGVPLEGLGLIWGVDRVLDMARTMVNMWANTCGTINLNSLQGRVSDRS